CRARRARLARRSGRRARRSGAGARGEHAAQLAGRTSLDEGSAEAQPRRGQPRAGDRPRGSEPGDRRELAGLPRRHRRLPREATGRLSRRVSVHAARRGDLLCLFGLLALGGALRAVHVGATSLWWDEIVQIQTAALPTVAEVVAQVRRGDPPGQGNAGAVPLDYLVLHAWQRVLPAPAPEWLEVHFRFPAWLFSTAAVGALFLYARRFFGRVAALGAAATLTVSVPHALYAGEARFY